MNNFIPRDLHDLVKLLKYNNMLKEIKYSINDNVVKAIVIDNLNNEYCYINGVAKGYRFRRVNTRLALNTE